MVRNEIRKSSENRTETQVALSRQARLLGNNGASRVRKWGNGPHSSQLHAQKRREFLDRDSRNRGAG
jgi:hypothetical protein